MTEADPKTDQNIQILIKPSQSTLPAPKTDNTEITKKSETGCKTKREAKPKKPHKIEMELKECPLQ